MTVKIGDIISPVGDENYCVVISNPNKDRIAKCIWNDGTVGTVFIGNVTVIGRLFEDIELRR